MKHPKSSKLRGKKAITQSMKQVVHETCRLWRKHHLGYDQTKYVVERVRRRLALEPPRGRRGRVHKTVHILRTLDDEEYRRRMGRELNKGEASHDLSRFLSFGKEGALRGRELGDQMHTFSCLSVLHNAVVAWNTVHIGSVVEQLRLEGHAIDDTTLSLTAPLFRKHINPFGKYHFDLDRMRQTADQKAAETP